MSKEEEHRQFLQRVYGVPVAHGLNSLRLPIATNFLDFSVLNDGTIALWYLSCPFAHERRQEHLVRVLSTGECMNDTEGERARYIGTIAGMSLHAFDVTGRYVVREFSDSFP